MDEAKARDRLAAALKRKHTRQKSNSAKDSTLRASITEDDLRRGTDAISVLASAQIQQGELDV